MLQKQASKQTIWIRPAEGWISLNLRELWRYRELIGFLAWRDILAQYKQAAFGIIWALAKPISQAAVFTIIFGKVAKLTSSGLPYPLFTLCGLIAWALFSASLSSSTVSVLANSNLITKVYFPRLVIPLSSMGRGMIDFLISFVIFIITMVAYGFSPGAKILLFPLFLLLGLAITLGFGLIFSVICVWYRDLAQALPFMIQLWFWITPVAYGTENIPSNLLWIFYLNPLTWIIQGFRWSLLGVGVMNWQVVLGTGLFAGCTLLAGLFYFKKMEGRFADII